MGDRNQFLYVNKIFNGFQGCVLEIGSKDYGNTQPFRELFSHCEYTGIDLEEGKNVDYAINLEKGLGPLEGKKFDIIIVCSVLEHSPRPWVLAENIQRLLSDEGAIISCHPWVWRYHKYPDDYFRFSPKGIMSIFNQCEYWLPVLYATTVVGEFFSFSQDEFIDNKLAAHNKEGRKYLPYLQSLMTGTRSKSTYGNLLEKMSDK